jgi:hypothetical protein
VILGVLDDSFLKDKIKGYSEISRKMVFEGFDAAPFFKALNRVSASDVIWLKEGPGIR